MRARKPRKSPASPRAAALEVLLQVLERGQTLDTALASTLAPFAAHRDRAFAQELSFGVLRWHPRLETVLSELLERPLKAKDRDLHLALLTGLYQLMYTRVPAYAAVAETVALATARNKVWARGLINGVLRRFERERETLLQRADAMPAGAFAHPAWLIEALRQAWPADWQRVLEENNRHAPMSLRVNQRRTDQAAYLERLAEAGMEAVATRHAPAGITLAGPVDVETLPGFRAGLVSVQDEAAQLAAPLLGLASGQRVLDACAAPGGKTGHILELEPDLAELVAIDRDPARAQRIDDNLQRLGLRATVACADAAEPAPWWDRRPFDRILLDAPCSATGVIRRHPDIKVLRRKEQLPELARRQARLLDALWPLLAPGGTLLYATCSTLNQENEAQLERFLAQHPGASVRPLEVTWGQPLAYGRQILPGDDGMDGFYYARLYKD